MTSHLHINTSTPRIPAPLPPPTAQDASSDKKSSLAETFATSDDLQTAPHYPSGPVQKPCASPDASSDKKTSFVAVHSYDTTSMGSNSSRALKESSDDWTSFRSTFTNESSSSSSPSSQTGPQNGSFFRSTARLPDSSSSSSTTSPASSPTEDSDDGLAMDITVDESGLYLPTSSHAEMDLNKHFEHKTQHPGPKSDISKESSAQPNPPSNKGPVQIRSAPTSDYKLANILDLLDGARLEGGGLVLGAKQVIETRNAMEDLRCYAMLSCMGDYAGQIWISFRDDCARQDGRLKKDVADLYSSFIKENAYDRDAKRFRKEAEPRSWGEAANEYIKHVGKPDRGLVIEHQDIYSGVSMYTHRNRTVHTGLMKANSSGECEAIARSDTKRLEELFRAHEAGEKDELEALKSIIKVGSLLAAPDK